MTMMICQASIDEHGSAKGGVAGDQTSKEVFVRDWYEAEWHTCLRPKNEELAQKSVASGFYDAFTDEKYLTSPEHLLPGDILVKKGHTIMVVGEQTEDGDKK